MNFQDIKKGWHWVWHSDSIWSWIVALVIIFVAVKFIFFPALSLIFGNELPLAGVESSSMDHRIVYDDYNRLTLCDNIYSSDEKKEIGYIDLDKYWGVCGGWYKDKNISKEQFSEFSLTNGFNKGDVIIVWGRFIPKIGDIIIFRPNADSTAPRPIIHRIVKINEDGTYQTKGDHNGKQLTKDNNIYKTDETHISQEQIIGKAIIKIPLLGWPKIWFTEFINAFR
ncbi:MAG: S24/S26 family peptidase [Candidatus Nanoarchaeia archaeon]|nr:S24/S26 family peptidase [Candidatus Nanoarchaeia archaeon]MDD5740448.1 S24/S26 family peptidase [Candidatus Nanoarchaeia archaeon]